MKFAKYNLDGTKGTDVSLDPALFATSANPQMIKDLVVAIRRNLRQWSASTRDRSRVNHSTQKPHKQKGTGKARQGRLSSPQYKGGGVVFGPQPKFDQHVKINKKERKSAVGYILGQFAAENALFVVQDPEMQAPKTKDVVKLLSSMQTKGRVLFVLESSHQKIDIADQSLLVSVPSHKYDHFKKSQSNLPGVGVALLSDLNAYQLLKAGTVVITESALKQLEEQGYVSKTSEKEKADV